MIGHLRGHLLRKRPQDLLVEVGGVGYRVLIPVSTFCRLGQEGDPVSLEIHTHVREDAFLLFGFATSKEHTLFEQLINVSGVGPKVALNVLSGIEADDLVEALKSGDLTRLTRIPGVGRKTAERLVLELKDKMAAFTPTEPGVVSAAGGLKDDLLSALANLGYSRAEAERGVDRAVREDGAGRFEDLLRRALQILSGR